MSRVLTEGILQKPAKLRKLGFEHKKCGSTSPSTLKIRMGKSKSLVIANLNAWMCTEYKIFIFKYCLFVLPLKIKYEISTLYLLIITLLANQVSFLHQAID